MTFHPLVAISTLVIFAVVGAALVLVAARRHRDRPPTWMRRLLMVVAVSVALAGPAVLIEEENVVSNVEIFIAVDRTGSMSAEDGRDGGTRLDDVRADILDLVHASPSARFAIVTWDSSARVELPVTTDTSAVVTFANNLHQEVTEFSSGSTLERPAAVVEDILRHSSDARPQNLRYLVVISDGESTGPETEGDPLDSWAQVPNLIDGGAVLGYGTPEGAPMQAFGVGGQGPLDEKIVDEDGNVAISRLDEQNLAALADLLQVPLYVNPSGQQVRELGVSFTDGSDMVVEGRRKSYTYWYMTWIPALVLSGLVTWEIVIQVRRAAHLRSTNAI